MLRDFSSRHWGHKHRFIYRCLNHLGRVGVCHLSIILYRVRICFWVLTIIIVWSDPKVQIDINFSRRVKSIAGLSNLVKPRWLVVGTNWADTGLRPQTVAFLRMIKT